MILRDIPQLRDLLPHGPEILLLDWVRTEDELEVVAVVEIGPDSSFLVAGHGVPAHVGLEYMAQTCGIYAGLRARRCGQTVRVGYLLGTRRYRSSRRWFVTEEILDVAARLILHDGPMAVFDCAITIGGGEVATAQLTVYQPDAGQGAAP